MTKLQEKIIELRAEQEKERAELLAKKLNLPYLDLKITPIDANALILIPEKQARQAKLAVIQKKGKKIFVVAQNPESPETKQIITDLEKSGYTISLFVSSLISLKKAWAIYSEAPKEPEKKIAGKVEIEKDILTSLQKKIKKADDIKTEIEKVPAMQASLIVEILLSGSLATDASDIHLEATKENIITRYRIDGMLQDVVFLSPKSYKYVLNRLKLLSGIKLNVSDQAQDGRFTIVADEADIEVRVSVIPSAYGENIVMRILNPKAINLKLEDLGLRDDLLNSISKEIKKPNGMIITTGPTGSGKTTLLYSLIKTINKPEVKIITLEDPVEYHLKGITQTQVESERGYTFASGLRAILRQDPDIVLVGEIRDQETADIAIQAALTGHLVLSTLHTNDAAGAIPRFLDIGVTASSIASALNTIIAQRLIRKICVKCRREITPSPEILTKIKTALKGVDYEYNIDKIYKAEGCEECNNTGYKGRIGIFEMIFKNGEMEKLINTSPGHIEVLDIARKNGMITFYQDGILKVLNGITTIEEIDRVATE
ncbi:MAG: GspE/PulE family protein [bacterium]